MDLREKICKTNGVHVLLHTKFVKILNPRIRSLDFLVCPLNLATKKKKKEKGKKRLSRCFVLYRALLLVLGYHTYVYINLSNSNSSRIGTLGSVP